MTEPQDPNQQKRGRSPLERTSVTGQLRRAERFLDWKEPIEPGLLTPVPRKLKPAKDLDHEHSVVGGLAVRVGLAKGCDCETQKTLIENGTAVQGQITEKREEDVNGTTKYYLDYAFEIDESEESGWGAMCVTQAQYEKVTEGDLVSVVYLQDKNGLTSRLYKFCSYRVAQF